MSLNLRTSLITNPLALHHVLKKELRNLAYESLQRRESSVKLSRERMTIGWRKGLDNMLHSFLSCIASRFRYRMSLLLLEKNCFKKKENIP